MAKSKKDVAVAQPIPEQEWFKEMVDDIKGAHTEGIHAYRWALIETYHSIGLRIIAEQEKFDMAGVKDKEKLSLVTMATGINERDLYRAIQFARTYPNANDVPGGKNVSWHKIVNDILPDPRDKHVCTKFEAVTHHVCTVCSKHQKEE